MTIGSENEKNQPNHETINPPRDRNNPALTVVIQTWATPIVGIIMLVIGLLGGYYGRQILTPIIAVEAVKGVESTNNNDPLLAIPTPEEDLIARQQEFMALVVENTRHFRGEPDAPVTIIEFSDFQ